MEKYNRQPLKELGQIMTIQNYKKTESEDIAHVKKLVFEKKITSTNNYCVVSRDIESGHICYIGSKDSDFIYYLHLIFDSVLGRMMLCNVSDGHQLQGQSTIKALKDFPVAIVSDEILETAIILDLSIKTVIDILKDQQDIQFLESAHSLMSELRDDFVLELYARDLFIANEIKIVDSLIEIIESSNDKELVTIVPLILKSITDPNGTLLTNMRRFRILMDRIINNVEK